MNKFPGKVLLFGEYTLLYNQRSLAIPFARYSGHWSFETADKSLPDLSPWALWLLEKSETVDWLDKKAIFSFQDDIKKGLWFDATIPQGYGLGSSGALVAGWYRRYMPESKVSAESLKKRFAQLESFFHGTSSGFDPLISYLQNAILLDQNKIKTIPQDNQLPLLSSCFILDTGITRSTAPLVQLFREKCQTPHFKNTILPQLIKAQSEAMDAFILGEKKTLEAAFFEISRIQWEQLSELIPESVKSIWKKGLEDKNYLLKLCGAGGGGCLLGLGIPPKTNFKTYPLQE